MFYNIIFGHIFSEKPQESVCNCNFYTYIMYYYKRQHFGL